MDSQQVKVSIQVSGPLRSRPIRYKYFTVRILLLQCFITMFITILYYIILWSITILYYIYIN